ncbi:alpha/beta hydrolase [Novosphingobium sp. KACC 22771]|uniref:alpha/beta hydrolase n=1 Tax=Novosphingobium sp. KACC 22771 TaxID=3025670 RepID=UPI0023653FD8|nr:alpha/beta hydrolase-fold protein [Novosphingobium sp. KACC 22771]WDF74862.1 alpha/beta hydrolase-fold protein [Novosphingobium sp. KACC 22771]
MRARKPKPFRRLLPILLCAAASPAMAQGTSCQKPWFTPQAPPVQSFEVLPDGRVTFRLCAPLAHEVLATSSDAGEVIPMGFPVGTPQGLVLTRDDTGLWSGTTAKPFKPGPYRYAFRVDGVRTADPYAQVFSRTRYGIEAVLEVPGSQFQAWDANLPHGAVASLDYWSASLKARRRAHVYTPPGYEKGGNQRYPVLYLVHGAGDNDESWTGIGHANQILDRLIAAGKVKPMIVVMPDGHTPDAARAIDFHAHDFGDDLTRDLIPLIDRTYRTTPTADARAMAGLSMGGSHTIREGLTRPGTFHWIGIFSMGVGIGSQTGVDPKRIEEYATENAASLKQAGRAMRLVYFAMGKEDFLYASVEPTRAVFDRFGIAHVYHESEGGHTWMNWRDYLADFAPRLFK